MMLTAFVRDFEDFLQDFESPIDTLLTYNFDTVAVLTTTVSFFHNFCSSLRCNVTRAFSCLVCSF